MELIYNGKIAGVSFEPARSGILKLAADVKKMEDIKVRLRHNPQNEYDSNALEVWAHFSTKPEMFLGHVPKPFNLKCLDVGLENLEIKFEQFTVQSSKIVGAIIEVIKKEMTL